MGLSTKKLEVSLECDLLSDIMFKKPWNASFLKSSVFVVLM